MGRFLYLSYASLPISDIRWKFYPIFELQYNHTSCQSHEEKELNYNYLTFRKYFQKFFNYRGRYRGGLVSTSIYNQIRSMIKLQAFSGMRLLTAIEYCLRTPKKIKGFQSRISFYNRHLDVYDRRFLIRPPNLRPGAEVSFPITIPMRVRHKWNPSKRKQIFLDDTSKIHWTRLTPNEILLGFENIQYLQYDEMVEGLRYLSEVEGQEDHDWNAHAWISRAFEYIGNNFNRIKNKDYLKMYYLMKKLNCKNEIFWKKMYAKIQENLYDLAPNEFQKFFLRYYKTSDQHFSPEMKQKFLTLMENRLRSFQPSAILQVYEIYQEENRLDDYWKFNVFIPLFKSQQYSYKPKQLYKIFRFMLIINHEKDDRLYASLYQRLKDYEKLTLEEVEMLEQVLGEIKDLFISHRVDPYFRHLDMMKRLAKKALAGQKKEIPIHELVRQDMVYLMNKRKIEAENAPKKEVVA